MNAARATAQRERAILVALRFGANHHHEHEREEFAQLAKAAGARNVACLEGSRRTPHPRHFVGAGKLEELRLEVCRLKADVVLFNHELSARQQNNLEQELRCRVLDRTGLILDIFAQHASSHVGKLQVELAQMEYMATRLVHGWQHLERQKGGIGLRGPGETQLETDRRLVRARIATLKRRLAKTHRQRCLARRARRRAAVPVVSLVGYTNTGKSTLFNALSGANSHVANQPFATLDATLRRIFLPPQSHIVLADTVGFIRQLPHGLVEAFHGTLEEVAQADLLLHVLDAQDEDRSLHAEQARQVLTEIHADQTPQLLVYNKIDLLGTAPRLIRDSNGQPTQVWVSAARCEGLELLRQAMLQCLSHNAAAQAA